MTFASDAALPAWPAVAPAARPAALATLHLRRSGRGRPLLLVHGLDGDARSFAGVLPRLEAMHEVIAVDLPCAGTLSRPGDTPTVDALADALARLIDDQGLRGVDAVGVSTGAQVVLELVRRGGLLGAVVALGPTGFGSGWERQAFTLPVALTARAARALGGLARLLASSPVGRTLLLAPFSPRPWRLPAATAFDALQALAQAPAAGPLPVSGPTPPAASSAGTTPQGPATPPLTIGWGRRDRLCLPRQAARAQALFPNARLHWFERCGHFPHWDHPAETAQLILETLGERRRTLVDGVPAAAAPARHAPSQPVSRPPRSARMRREPLIERA